MPCCLMLISNYEHEGDQLTSMDPPGIPSKVLKGCDLKAE